MGFQKIVLVTAVSVLLIGALGVFLLARADGGSVCGGEPEAVLERDPEIRISLEVAATPEERARGLMFRDSLDSDTGMLFVFGQPARSAFWMRNTLIPLSIAFLGENGEVLDVQDMEPLSEELHFSREAYWYALETNRGWFAAHDVKVGDRLIICLPPEPSGPSVEP